MALLYVGPRNAPDLHSDYHLSPIFTPSHMLAQFPPVYMSCGERDPLVDDTVIFAGKLREAKESRKMELLAREARHGDRLRMSTSGTKRDPLLDEDENDWVRTSIIAGWSHGYLQMVSLLPAAERVIAMHADWIVEAFECAREKDALSAPQVGTASSARSPARQSATPATPPPTLPRGAGAAATEQMVNVVPPTPVLTQKTALSPEGPASPEGDSLAVQGSSALSDGEDDDILTFTPKNRRASSNASRGSGSPPVLPSLVSPPNLSPDLTELNEADQLPPCPDGQSPGLPAHLVTTVERAMRDEPTVLRRPPPLSVAGSSASTRPATPARPQTAPRTSSVPTPSPSRSTRAERTLSLSPPPASTPRTGRSPSGSTPPGSHGAVFIDARDLMRRRKEDVVYGIVSGTGSRTSSPPPPRKSSESGRRGSSSDVEGDAHGAQFDRRRTVE